MRVLLAGTARCGSTWVANVLGRAADTQAVFEPDGPASDLLGAMVASRLGEFPALGTADRSLWYRLTWDLAFTGGWPWARAESARAAGRQLVRLPKGLRDYLIAAIAESTRLLRRAPRHVVVKSVNSAFALEWIAARYSPTVVILRRNPLNVVSSWAVLGLHPGRIRVTDSVRRRLPARALDEPDASASAVTVAAWNVGLLTAALKTAAARHPEWIVESHDALCAEPVARFRALSERIGLGWRSEMEDYIARSDDPGFVVYGGSQRVHPNAGSSTAAESRRTQQATQFRRRLSDVEVAEARAVLERFQLEDWGVVDGHAASPSQVDLSTPA
jgi:hypothetical protein